MQIFWKPGNIDLQFFATIQAQDTIKSDEDDKLWWRQQARTNSSRRGPTLREDQLFEARTNTSRRPTLRRPASEGQTLRTNSSTEVNRASRTVILSEYLKGEFKLESEKEMECDDTLELNKAFRKIDVVIRAIENWSTDSVYLKLVDRS